MAGALEISSQAACVSVYISLCCSTWIRRPFPPLPLAGLYVACARRHGEGTPKAPGPRASCPHPGRGTVLVLGDLEVPQSPHPDLAACKVGCWGWQRAGRGAGRAGSAGPPLPAWCVGRVTSSPAANPHCTLLPETKPVRGRTAAALDVTRLFVTRPGGSSLPSVVLPVLAEPVAQGAGEWVHLPPQGDGWVWGMGTLTLGLCPCHESPQGSDSGPQALGGTSLQD